jgi:hypothetical protein
MREFTHFLLEDLFHSFRHGEFAGLVVELLDELVLPVRLDAELTLDALHLLP